MIGVASGTCDFAVVWDMLAASDEEVPVDVVAFLSSYILELVCVVVGFVARDRVVVAAVYETNCFATEPSCSGLRISILKHTGFAVFCCLLRVSNPSSMASPTPP